MSSEACLRLPKTEEMYLLRGALALSKTNRKACVLPRLAGPEAACVSGDFWQWPYDRSLSCERFIMACQTLPMKINYWLILSSDLAN